jgi:zinc protease
MLMRGTAKKSRQEIEDAQDRLRAQIGVSGNEVGASASGQTFRKELPDVLRLVAEVLREPAFALPELETLKRERATGLEASRSDPQQVAVRALRREGNPYPVGDPRYAPTLDEELTWAKAVTPESMKKFHGQFYGTNKVELPSLGTSTPKPCARSSPNSATGTARAPTRPTRWCRKAVAQVRNRRQGQRVLIGRESLPLNDMSPDYPTARGQLHPDSGSSRLLNGCGRRRACPTV